MIARQFHLRVINALVIVMFFHNSVLIKLKFLIKRFIETRPV
jgi:hypothetical protein